MNQESFFCHLGHLEIESFILTAQRAVVYAGPAIHLYVAEAMVEVSKRLGTEMLTLNMDLNENVFRMGYGDFKSVTLLKDTGISINHTPGLRSALLIVDDKGYSFTPVALYLEEETKNNNNSFNAIRFTRSQVKEALARLSPVAKAIAIAQSESDDEKEKLEHMTIEVESMPAETEMLEKVKKSLEEAPPVNFDMARQVRVYEAYLQYVEISLTGAAIQRHRLSIPIILQKVGVANKEIEGRLRTTFELIDKDGSLSSKPLENELNEIRKDFTRSMGKAHGRVILKNVKAEFEKELDKFRKKLEKYAQTIESELQEQINKSKEEVIQYYLPDVKDNPPNKLKGEIPGELTDDLAKQWISQQLDPIFPNATGLIKTMKLDVNYKDVTYETLNRDDFLTLINKAYPMIKWDKIHGEFIAASEK